MYQTQILAEPHTADEVKYTCDLFFPQTDRMNRFSAVFMIIVGKN